MSFATLSAPGTLCAAFCKARLMIVQTVLSNTSFIAESSLKPQN